ncbi:Hypothetical predicted protein [Scomber scombrus]|uniref:Uncharacterized protein n=1 Tax=Scomber scombrus TaxID=13677 RepID=A0AAV1N668_SCOSC
MSVQLLKKISINRKKEEKMLSVQEAILKVDFRAVWRWSSCHLGSLNQRMTTVT